MEGEAMSRLRAAALGRALAALEADRPAVAEAEASAWLMQNPHDTEAILLLGLAVAAQGDAARAAPYLQSVARARPGFAHPCRDLALLCPDRPFLIDAQFRACRAIAPEDAGLACAHAEFLIGLDDAAGAIKILHGSLGKSPSFGPAFNLLGMALHKFGDLPGAITAFRRAVFLDPNEGAVWTNLGMALSIEGQFNEAVAAHDQAVACAPEDKRLRTNRSVALLRAGRLAEGWSDYEARLNAEASPALPQDRRLPALDGLDLSGRVVLAWHAEGFGDTLQFCRYLPLLAARGARVLACVPSPLNRLLRALPGVTLLPDDAPLPAYDYHVPISSLPRVFGTVLTTIPADSPYLHADPVLVDHWAARLPAAQMRVGLVWAGQARPWLSGFASLNRRRSLMLAELAELAAVPGLMLVSLQKGPEAEQVRICPDGWGLHDPMAAVIDFADTAAIIANLDVVVSVDTSVVHLAGAMGKRVLLLDRYDSCWRWLSGREDSPWYPDLRILRQKVSGDWAPVVARAAALVAEMRFDNSEWPRAAPLDRP